MSNERTELGRMIEQGLREAVAYRRGELAPARAVRVPITAREADVHAPPHYGPEQVQDIRERTRMSQAVFASALNVSPRTVQAWEQGRREPSGASLRLLEFADREPEAFCRSVMGDARIA